MVFKRWMKVVWVMVFPPAGPSSDPMDCNKTQLIAPALGQLASDPARIEFTGCPHTLLLSKELCQVTLPNGTGSGANSLGLVSVLRKCRWSWAGKYSLDYPRHGPT